MNITVHVEGKQRALVRGEKLRLDVRRIAKLRFEICATRLFPHDTVSLPNAQWSIVVASRHLETSVGMLPMASISERFVLLVDALQDTTSVPCARRV